MQNMERNYEYCKNWCKLALNQIERLKKEQVNKEKEWLDKVKMFEATKKQEIAVDWNNINKRKCYKSIFNVYCI